MEGQNKLNNLVKQVRQNLLDKHGDLFLNRDSNNGKKKEIILREIRELAGEIDREDEDYLVAHLIGFGKIEKLLKDRLINEIMINKPDEVYIEKQGRMIKTGIKFDSVDEVMDLLQRMVHMSGRRVDFSHPLVNARLKAYGNVRVNAVVPPNSEYPVITIRKFVQHRFTAEELLQQGYMSEEMLTFFRYAVMAKANIVVCGAAGSGKTTFQRFLASFIPAHERIIVIEDTRELQPDHPHVVSLEASEKVDIYDLMVNALRMRPDRIILSECRGMETFELLQAMNTGHSGSITGVHSNYGKMELVNRLVQAMIKSGMSDRELIKHITGALDLSVFLKKYRGGAWRIAHVAEIQRKSDGSPGFNDIYRYDRQQGKHLSVGSLSKELIDRLEDNLEEKLPGIKAFGGGTN